MCCRFAQALDWTEYFQMMPDLVVVGPPGISYNIAPTHSVPVVTWHGRPEMEEAKWGLMPSWMDSYPSKLQTMNARAETLHEKPAFRDAYGKRRCLIPASGFYEWQTDPKSKRKQPMYIRLAHQRILCFAGLWEVNERTGSRITSFTIITTEPNEMMSQIHNRMPLIISPSDWRRWLEPTTDPTVVKELLRPYPSEEMAFHPVNPHVGKPAFNEPECIAPWSEKNSQSSPALDLFGEF